MAANLARAGYDVVGFDTAEDALATARDNGIKVVGSIAEAAAAGGIVVSMLPDGPIVRRVYLDDTGVIANAAADALMVDCSTIDVDSARAVAAAAKPGQAVLDAPVSGGVEGAQAGKLTFMVGGDDAYFEKAKPLFEVMGKAAVHAGQAGNGQVAKACNNMMLGICMLATSEAFTLAEKQGLDTQKLFEISSQASGANWAMMNHNPVPGLVPTAAANRGYTPGFAAGMMWKDLKLAQAAAQQAGVATPLGSEAQALFAVFCAQGHETKDYSGIYRMLRGEDVA
jgi:3-hydroxyisobutyrate dehydrogenase